MRKLIIAIFICLLWNDLHAQDNLQLQFGYRGTVAAAKYLPSTQILNNKTFELSLEYNLWVANNSISYSSIRDIYLQEVISGREIDNLIDDMYNDNRIGGGQDFMVVGFGYQRKIKEIPVVFNFSIYDRLLANFNYPKNLAQFIWKGNKQFEGSTLNFSKTNISGLYFREFSIGAALDVAQINDWGIRVGGRLNYYMGLSGLSSANSTFLFTTGENAESIDIDFDVKYFYTGIDDFDFFDPRGHGFGGDIGATFSYKESLNFDIGITDMGSIKFKNDVTEVNNQDIIQFSGLDKEELVDLESFADSLTRIFTPSERENVEFRMPVGAKLSFMASYVMNNKSKKHGPRTLYFFYRQGFKESPGGTTNPKFSLAIHRRFFRHLHIGFSTSFGGFNRFGAGGMLGFEYDRFRMSFHSDDFTGLISPKNTTAAGGGFIFQFFPRNKAERRERRKS